MGFFFFRSFFSPTILMGVRSAKVRNQSCFKEPVPLPPVSLFWHLTTIQRIKSWFENGTHPRSKLPLYIKIKLHSHAIISLLRRRSALMNLSKRKKCSCCLEWLVYVSLSADWLWLATIYICIDRPTPIAKLTSPLAISRLKSDQIQWTRDNNRENGEQDFFNNRQISRPLSSSSAGFIGDAFEKLPSIFDNIFSLHCLVRVCTFDVIVWQHDGDDMQWKRKENFFFFYIVGFQCLCSCVTAGGWSRERNSSKRFLSFPF